MKNLLALAVFLLVPSLSQAVLLNGNFETGSLSPWETLGDVLLVDSSFGVAPSQGHLQVLMTTAPTTPGVDEHPQNYSGTDAASIIGGGGTKTVRSNREIHLHDNVVAALKDENPAPLSVDPDDHFFTTPDGTPIDESNFYKREWLPILRAKEIRERPFYNTRHTYVSFLYSIGASSGFISKQTGDSIKTLETDYAKYIEEADSRRDFVEAEIQKSATLVQPPSEGDDSPAPPEKKKPLENQGLKGGAGEEGRTPDLMLGKHTL